MRNLIALLVSLAALTLTAPAFAQQATGGFDWESWQRLPVQGGGRQKPLDTLAWETLRLLANEASFVDPDSGEELSYTAFYLGILFDWQGWDLEEGAIYPGGVQPRTAYFTRHKEDKWDNAPLLEVNFLALREALGMEADQKYISPQELNEAQIVDPDGGKSTPFVVWAQRLARGSNEGRTTFEKKGVALAHKFWLYQEHRMGLRMELVPAATSERQDWVPLAYLLQTKVDDKTDPRVGAIQEQFHKARNAYRTGNVEQFNRATATFVRTARELGSALGVYPAQDLIDLEVTYNHRAPFRYAWVLTLLAFSSLLLAMGTKWKVFDYAGWAAYVGGFLAMIVGFWMRTEISGRAPVTNMYESVIYLGLGTAFFGLIFECFHRKRYILTAAAAVTTVALVLADNCPAVLDPSLQPLQPVLRSNFWLVTHVMSITLSYAAFALALGISDITLGYFMFGSQNENEDTIRALSKFTYRSLQVGVLLLAVGTILGAVWADYSWGRFWGWDPKEVWALIALLGYLAVLHAQYAGWVRHFGLAALSVVCFSLVVMAWYGVNFVLGAGLHSYGFGGSSGQGYVYAAVALQWLYVLAAALGRLVFTPNTAADAEPSADEDATDGF